VYFVRVTFAGNCCFPNKIKRDQHLVLKETYEPAVIKQDEIDAIKNFQRNYEGIELDQLPR